MSKETIDPSLENDPQALGWVPAGSGSEYRIPPEAYHEQARNEYDEVQRRLATLRSIFDDYRRNQFGIPPHLRERYERLVVRRTKLEQQLGLNQQFDIEFPSTSDFTSRAARGFHVTS